MIIIFPEINHQYWKISRRSSSLTETFPCICAFLVSFSALVIDGQLTFEISRSPDESIVDGEQSKQIN
jgi:hypothetical protein